MAKIFFGISCLSAIVLLCMFYPFLSGSYDELAITLSSMSQVFCIAGCLLIPLGFAWLWFGKNFAAASSAYERRLRWLVITTLLTLALVVVCVSLGALLNYNLAFGIIFLTICFLLLSLVFDRIRLNISLPKPIIRALPLYLILLPVIALSARMIFFNNAVNFSRHLAIKNSLPLITAIEEHYKSFGKYPVSLQALHTDILPQVKGIRQYHYEPNGKAYNLYFKQFSDEPDVEEIVMYNKLDEHAFAAHALDILEYSGDEVALRRGDRHKYKLPFEHWVYIKFE